MATFRPAIHKKTREIHTIDLETANLKEYEIDGNYGGEANNGAIDSTTNQPIDLTIEKGIEETRASMKAAEINNAIAKNPTNKK